MMSAFVPFKNSSNGHQSYRKDLLKLRNSKFNGPNVLSNRQNYLLKDRSGYIQQNNQQHLNRSPFPEVAGQPVSTSGPSTQLPKPNYNTKIQQRTEEIKKIFEENESPNQIPIWYTFSDRDQMLNQGHQITNLTSQSYNTLSFKDGPHLHNDGYMSHSQCIGPQQNQLSPYHQQFNVLSQNNQQISIDERRWLNFGKSMHPHAIHDNTMMNNLKNNHWQHHQDDHNHFVNIISTRRFTSTNDDDHVSIHQSGNHAPCEKTNISSSQLQSYNNKSNKKGGDMAQKGSYLDHKMFDFIDSSGSDSDVKQEGLAKHYQMGNVQMPLMMQQQSIPQQASPIFPPSAPLINQTFNQQHDMERYQFNIPSSPPPTNANPTGRRGREPSVKPQQTDEEIMIKVMIKSMLKKISEKALIRQDVIIKTIFRMYRSFYKHKHDVVWGKKRKGKPRPEVVGSLDLFTEKFIAQLQKKDRFSNETQESLSNYLGALIMPKCIQQMKVDQALQQQMSHYNTAVGSSTSSTTSLEDQRFNTQDTRNKNSSNSAHQHVDKRMQRIIRMKDLAQDIHMVLYQYNKERLQSFFDQQENLLTFEYFLALASNVIVQSGPLDKQLEKMRQKKAQDQSNSRREQHSEPQEEDEENDGSSDGDYDVIISDDNVASEKIAELDYDDEDDEIMETKFSGERPMIKAQGHQQQMNHQPHQNFEERGLAESLQEKEMIYESSPEDIKTQQLMACKNTEAPSVFKFKNQSSRPSHSLGIKGDLLINPAFEANACGFHTSLDLADHHIKVEDMLAQPSDYFYRQQKMQEQEKKSQSAFQDFLKESQQSNQVIGLPKDIASSSSTIQIQQDDQRIKLVNNTPIQSTFAQQISPVESSEDPLIRLSRSGKTYSMSRISQQTISRFRVEIFLLREKIVEFKQQQQMIKDNSNNVIKKQTSQSSEHVKQQGRMITVSMTAKTTKKGKVQIKEERAPVNNKNQGKIQQERVSTNNGNNFSNQTYQAKPNIQRASNTEMIQPMLPVQRTAQTLGARKTMLQQSMNKRLKTE